MRPHEGEHSEGDDRKQCDDKKSRCPRRGRHSTAEVENPPDGERTDEAADVTEHGMNGERCTATRRLRGAGGSAVSDDRVEPDDGSVEKEQRSRQGVGRGAERPSRPAQAVEARSARTMSRRRPRRIAASLPRMLATVPARPSMVQRRCRRNKRCGRAGRSRYETEESDTPAAQRAHLERVDPVDDRVRHGGAIAQHRTEVDSAPRARGGAALVRGTATKMITQASAAVADARRTPPSSQRDLRRDPRRRMRARLRCRCLPHAPPSPAIGASRRRGRQAA